MFGPTKTDKARPVDLGPETLILLRDHKRRQAELTMQNRTSYHDLALVFAREVGVPSNARAALGNVRPDTHRHETTPSG